MRPHRRQPTRLPRPWDSPGKNTGAGCHFLLQCMKVKSESEVAQSCPTLSDPMNCSLPGSSVHGIFQARVLRWGAIAFSVQLQWCGCKPRSASSHQKLDKQGLGHFWELLEKVWPCPCLDLGLLSFRTMREQISTVFRHQFLLIWYSSPRKLTQAVRLSDIGDWMEASQGVPGSASDQEA